MTLDGFDELQKMSWHFASHRVVTVAARLGILNALNDAPKTPEQLSEELSLESEPVSKILGVLSSLQVVHHQCGAFVLSPHMRPLFNGGNADMKAFMMHSHFMYDGWGENLEDWVRGNKWQRRTRSPEQVVAFGEAMRAIAFHVSKRLLTHLKLDGVRSMLDVGGGTGMYVKAFCDASSELRGTVFDTPETAALGRERFSGTEYERRISFLEGDFLADDFGHGYDLVLLSNVLHQEEPDSAKALLERSIAALNPGGRAVIVEFAIDDDKCEHLMGTLFSVNMRSFGNTYSAPELRLWMEQCGLVEIRREDLDSNRWMFVGTK